MIKNFKIHLIFLFFLANCSWLNHQISPKFVSSNDFINRFPANKQGVVLFKFSSKYPSTLWCKYDDNDEILENDCFEIKPSKYYQILMAEPGLYEIRGYEKITKLYGENRINPQFSQKTHQRKTKPIMAFEVKEEKVSFLGHIDYKSSKFIKKNSYDQEFEHIKKLLIEKDLEKLQDLFSGHKYEIDLLNNQINGDIKNYLIKDEIKTKKDFKNKKRKKIKKKKIIKYKLKSKYDY